MLDYKSRWIAGVAGLSLMSCVITAYADAEPANPIGRFEITRFEVDGNTLLPAQTVDQAVAPFAGKDRDFVLRSERTRSSSSGSTSRKPRAVFSRIGKKLIENAMIMFGKMP